MRLLASVVSVAFLVVSGPALALQVGVGGVSVSVGGGGVSASVGGTSVGASVGGGGASVSASTGGNGANVGVTGNGGSLIGVDRANGTTSATINLGSALNGFLTDPVLGDQLSTINLNNAFTGVGPRNSPAERVRRAFQTLSLPDRRRARLTCAQVLRNPGAFDKNTRILCSLVARL